MKVATRPARLVVVETVYHQQDGSSATCVDSRYSRPVGDEQPYSRRLTVGEEWTQLDTGWLKTASILSIKNLEGEGRQRVPTEEERKEVAARVILLGYSRGADWLIPPGESFRGSPINLDALWIRCRSGQATCLLTLFPG